MATKIATRSWPDDAQLEANRRKLKSRLRKEIARFESDFGIPSDALPEALNAGTVEEDHAVAEWLIALDTLRALERGESA